MDSVEKGTFFLIISNLVFFLSGYAIYFVLGGFLLSPEDFGTYGVVIALFTTINMVLVNSIQQSVAKFLSEQPDLAEAIKRRALQMQFLLSGVFFAAFYFSAPFLAQMLQDPSLAWLIQFSGLIFFSHPIYAIFSGCLNGTGKFKKLALLQIIYSIAKMCLIIGLVFLGFSVFGAVGGFIAASFLAALLGWAMVGFKKPAGFFSAKKLLLFTLPLFAFAVIQNLSLNVDLLAVKSLAGQNSAALSGYYVAAQSISRIPYLVVAAVTLVLFPLVSALTYGKQAQKVRFYINNAMRYSLLFLVPAAALSMANSSQLLGLIYRSKYMQAAASLEILSIGTVFFALFLLLSTVISSSGRPGHSMAIGFASLAALFALLFLLVPQLSIEGAAIASTAAYFLGFLLSGAYVWLKFRALVAAKAAAKIIFAGAVVYFVSLYIPAGGLLLLAELAAMLLLYAIILFAIKGLDKKDLDVFLRMVR